YTLLFFFSSRRRHTRSKRDWSSDVCSSDLEDGLRLFRRVFIHILMRIIIRPCQHFIQFVEITVIPVMHRLIQSFFHKMVPRDDCRVHRFHQFICRLTPRSLFLKLLLPSSVPLSETFRFCKIGFFKPSVRHHPEHLGVIHFNRNHHVQQLCNEGFVVFRFLNQAKFLPHAPEPEFLIQPAIFRQRLLCK